MELDKIKLTWDTLQTQQKPMSEINTMLLEKKHPVLKNIRKQFLIELFGWCVFLSCYYSMFDGHEKPIWVNICLILSISLPIFHNLLWFRLPNNPMFGKNMQTFLQKYLSKIKTYGWISIITRQIYLLGLLFFLTYSVNFNKEKYLLLALIFLFLLVQLFLTVRMWRVRFRKIQYFLEAFN